MRHYAHRYETDEGVRTWLDACEIRDSQRVLIQVFSGIIAPDRLSNVSRLLRSQLPDATVVGVTTHGEIFEGKMYDESIVISISVFDNATIKSVHRIGEDFVQLGEEIANSIVDEQTKCIIMFADGLRCNGEMILQGLSRSLSGNVVVAGGMAADNGVFSQTYCLHQEEVFQGGVVAVALSGSGLEVFHTYNLSWKPIGKKMVITKAVGNVVYEIDNRPAIEVYAKYLGDEVVKQMPLSTIEFPLIFEADGVSVARSMVGSTEDGGIVYAGGLPEGTGVRFGIGSPNLIRDSVEKMYHDAGENLLEGIFVYSCSARKHLLQKDLEMEFHPLAKLAPMAGFFTYGEFFSGPDANTFLNVTTTVLGLSEVKQKRGDTSFDHTEYTDTSTTINALIHLVEAMMQEDEQNNQRYKSIIQTEPECVKVVDQRGRLLEMNPAGLGMLEAETLQDAQSMSLVDFLLPEWRGDFIALHKKVMGGENGELTFEVQGLKGTRRWLETHATPLRDEEGNVISLLGITRDITKKIEDEKIYRMQARQAQMGEMISMIAHQWRQPLTIIGTIASTMKVQEHLKENADADVIKQIENIEQQTLHLSQTISDFRDFFRPDKPKERVRLEEIMNSAIGLIGRSFETSSVAYILNVKDNSEIVTFRNEVLQVIITMLKNSLDAFSVSKTKNPFVQITLDQNGEYATIEIRDNAGGIHPDVIDKIFLPYFTTKHSSTGTGLGLYMSKMIIEEHCKGILEVKSENYETVFMIKLKLKDV